MTAWLEPQEIDLPEGFSQAVGGHPLVAQTIYRRGIHQVEAALAFIKPDSYVEAPAIDLPDIAEACDRLLGAIRSHEQILVWGDFDVDGQTSTSLLVGVLRQLGGEVSFHIPVRASESHGITIDVLGRLVEDEIPGGIGVLLTCDTGVSAHDAVDYANGRGIDVIVTDHHELPESLPKALAIINPKRLPPDHPLGALPGVGVAYKLAQELCDRLGNIELAAMQLDLVALGIVADLAFLTGDTRYLLQRGLETLRISQRPGLLAIFDRLDFSQSLVTEEHISFALAPRLNALGRLSDANPVVELLITPDSGKARFIALELEGLNARRKLLTTQVFQGAIAQIEQDPSLLETNAIVLSHPTWPAGIIGIVASRLVEQYNMPVIMISSPPGAAGRGSARSIAGVNITAAIAAQSDILHQYGGHPMAAGLSIDPERIPEFRRRLSRTLETLGALPVATYQLDGYLEFSELSLDLVADLERLAPFGPANPSLKLASRNLRLVSCSTIGRDEEHLLLTVEDGAGSTQKVLWWHGAGWPLPDGRFDLVYSVRAVTYRGQREVQVEWLDYRPVPLLEVSITQPEPIHLVDYRQVPHPLVVLKQFLAREIVQVWVEGDAARKLTTESVHAVNRQDLQPGPTLAIWTAPPGKKELQEALEKVKPARVLLFALRPESEQIGDFLSRLAGMAKYATNHKEGFLNLEKAAATTAQTVPAVHKGLDWLVSKGLFEIVSIDSGSVQLQLANTVSNPGELARLSRELRELLEETRAFRDYLSRVSELKL